MNENEKYLFDLRGYIVVRNALTPEQVRDLSDRLALRVSEMEQRKSEDSSKRKRKKSIYGSDRTRFRDEDDPAWSAPSLLEWGGTYIDLIDIPTIKPYLETLLGNHYRLDHDYIKIDSARTSPALYLHGGGQGSGGPADLVGPTDGGQCFYRYSNGRFFNGLVSVAFELDTVNPGDGGFACIPGSHKSNFALPEDWRVSSKQQDVPDIVDRVAASAGDAIIFTEACAHGTIPWKGNNQRRTIFYKYCPHAVAWSPCFYNSDLYGDLTESQLAKLMPPSAFGPAKHTRNIWQKAQAEQAELYRLRRESAAKQR